MSRKLVEAYGKDVNHPTSLIMSGVESDSYWDLAVGAGFDRLLVSFHYIQRKGKRWLRERMAKHPNVKLMVDSGAYTFHANIEEYKDKPVSYYEDYVTKYTNWIKDNKDIIFSCVEVDIANIVGYDKVDEFRRDYFEPLKDEGVLVCYVWHDFDGKPYWEEMCKKYDYVGFSLQTGSLTESEIMKFVNTAKRYGSLVHGFALTRVELMSKVPFFTGDSTTWLVGTQYGELNWFDGRRMKRLKKKDWKTVYKQKYIKLGAVAKLMEEENPYELIRINALVFKEAEKYVRKRIRARMYWMKDSEEGAGGIPMTKKLIRRKPKNEAIEADTKEVTKKKIIVPTNIPVDDKPVPTESGNGNFIPDRPKTKFEEFEELSKGEEKIIHDLDSQIDKLPSLEWFEGDTEDYKEVAKSLNINLTALPQDEILDVLYNFCIFLRDTEMVDEQEDDVLTDLVKMLLSVTVDSREVALEHLVGFYSKNLTGERSDFKVDEFGGNMEAPPRPTEREEYLEDEEFVKVDMSEEEMANYLPAPKEGEDMPEVSEIDAELNRSGIVAIRDEKGRFLKGQKIVRKPKQIYSKHFPKLACNTCYKAGECPEYKPDHACAYENIFKKFKTRDMDDLMDAMFGMADLNMERMSRLALFETMDGGMPDPTLTTMIDQNLNIMIKMKQLHEAKASIVATQRRTMSSDGTMETTTSVTNPNGGILAQIFGMGNNSTTSMDEEENADAPKKRKDITPKDDIIDN